jgi:hypothetical protein
VANAAKDGLCNRLLYHLPRRPIETKEGVEVSLRVVPEQLSEPKRACACIHRPELFPVPYYHVVFTLPAAIGDIAYQNKAIRERADVILDRLTS